MQELEFERAARETARLDLAGRDPEEGMTSIAYDKGYQFLRMLEEQFGRERWDAFLRGYFDDFAFRSMTTGDFVVYLRDELIDDPALEEQLRIDEWIDGPGLPANAPRIVSEAFAQVESELRSFSDGKPASRAGLYPSVRHQAEERRGGPHHLSCQWRGEGKSDGKTGGHPGALSPSLHLAARPQCHKRHHLQ